MVLLKYPRLRELSLGQATALVTARLDQGEVRLRRNTSSTSIFTRISTVKSNPVLSFILEKKGNEALLYKTITREFAPVQKQSVGMR